MQLISEIAAQFKFEAGEFDAALANVEAAIRLDPNDAGRITDVPDPGDLPGYENPQWPTGRRLGHPRLRIVEVEKAGISLHARECSFRNG